MTQLKKINSAIVLITVVLLTSSCEKWLDVSPKSEVKYSDLFSNKNGFKDQLTGVYAGMAAERLYGANLTYGMVDVLGQQYVWTQEMGRYYYLNRFEYQNASSKAIFSEVWSGLYSSVANINILLDGIKDHPDVLSEDEKRIYKGEALGLRAFLHFDILRLFGESMTAGANKPSIPYVSEISKKVPPLLTVSEVLDKVISDLKEAEELLAVDPIITNSGNTPFLGTRKFHFNYYAAKALLSRTYMYKKDDVNAFKYAKEVIESNKFPWITRDRVTAPSRESRDGTFSSEGIFVLNNLKLDDLTRRYLREGGTDYVNLLKSDKNVIAEIFETDRFGGYDWRYNYFFQAQAGQFLGNTKLWQFYYNGVPAEYLNRQPLMRISELFLIAAECAPAPSIGVEYFNTLRQHRGFEKDQDLSSDISKELLQNEIKKEYRKEFIGEGQWLFYCKRADLDVIPNIIVPFNKKFYVLPMPDQEIEYGNRK